MISGTDNKVDKSKSLYRKANKIINLWVQKELPYTYEHIVKKAIEINQRKLQEEALLDGFEAYICSDESSRKIHEELADVLNDNPNFNIVENFKTIPRLANGPESELMEEVLLSLKRLKAAIEYHPTLSENEKQLQRLAWIKQYRIYCHENSEMEKKHWSGKEISKQFDYTYNLYLYPEDRDDDDIEVDLDNFDKSQKETLREIKNLIKQSSGEELRNLNDINLLFMKILRILPNLRFELQSAQDFLTLEKWGKIALWLVEKMNQHPYPKGKSSEDKNTRIIIDFVKSKTKFMVRVFYLNLAYYLAQSSRKENVFADNFMEIAAGLEKVSDEVAHVKYIDQLRLCVLSRLALNKGDISAALAFIEEAYHMRKDPEIFVIEMLYYIGVAYAQLNKEITIKCYRRAVALITSQKQVGVFNSLLQPNVDNAKMAAFICQYRAAIIDELKKEFKNIKVTIRNNVINIFLSLDQIPRTQIKLSKNSPISCLKHYSNYQFKDKKLTGYQFVLSDENFDASIHAVRDLTTKISKYLDAEVSRKVVFEKYNAATVSTLKPVIAAIKDMGIRDVENMSNMQNNPSEPKKPANRNQKHKSSSTTTTTTTTKPAVMPQRTHKRIAADYGFTCFSRNPVTPVYFSHAHKDSGNPAQIVVCWDDSKAEDLDPIIVDKFKDLFNAQGVVQTRQVGESGFKICIGKGNEWIVRGKLKGVGGSTRVYFKPTQTLTNEDKSTTTLCVLHKKMSK